ncbi:MAG: four helix bundle protein [Hyphomicrobiales bacterium]|nr:four helix bundle protein [Hyphomicrobiales bacterium]
MAMTFVEQCYALSSRFPIEERYGLTAQLRRAAVSVPSNIAEGFGRGTTAGFRQYLRVAQGSFARSGDANRPVGASWFCGQRRHLGCESVKHEHEQAASSLDQKARGQDTRLVTNHQSQITCTHDPEGQTPCPGTAMKWPPALRRSCAMASM